MNLVSKMSVIPSKTDIKVTSPRKSIIFTGDRGLNIMPEVHSESNSELNKKNLACNLVHF
jgi:hypothetical protein